MCIQVLVMLNRTNVTIDVKLLFEVHSVLIFHIGYIITGLIQASSDEQWSRAMEYVSKVSELNYMTQIVIMLYEDTTKVRRFYFLKKKNEFI